jgi:hypothetical protein
VFDLPPALGVFWIVETLLMAPVPYLGSGRWS